MNKLYIVMYHYTRDLVNSRYPNIKGMDSRLFKKQIEFFQQNFHVVTMEKVLEAIHTGRRLPEKAMLLTFDDGYIDNYTVALPILKEYQMQGSFFIPGKTFLENTLLDVNKVHFILASATVEELLPDVLGWLDYYRDEYDYPSNEELFQYYGKANRWDGKETVFIKRILQTGVPEAVRNKISSELFAKYVGVSEETFARELYMNRDQIEFLKREGMYIGVHGYDHYWMGNLSWEELDKDISRALDALEGIVDREAWVLNYPYGNYCGAVVDYVKKRGCVLGLTVEARVADLEADSRYLLPRLDCNDFPPKNSRYEEVL